MRVFKESNQYVLLLTKLDRAILGYILLAQKAARGLLSALPRRDT